MLMNRRVRGVVTIGLAAALLGVMEASPASAAPIGKVRQGKATFYTDRGTGACGKPVDAANQRIVAVSPKWWTAANPNKDPLCRLKVRVTYRGKSITVPVRDKCAGCGPHHIDLGRPAFAELAAPSKGVIKGVKWKFVR
ncbi:RlpA-like double-psi beta-barrel domain-containing protein [Streptomyces atrovirens]|uniref:Cysteine/serine endopeptidase inhibitor n=1 Tax=Streptomyces atrovirens TaxID=285556 RepID=A0ABW0DNH6_9ACTN